MPRSRFLSKVRFLFLSPHRWRINQFECNRFASMYRSRLELFPHSSRPVKYRARRAFLYPTGTTLHEGGLFAWCGVSERNSQNGCFFCLLLLLATTFDVPGFSWKTDHRLGVTFESEMSYGNGLNIHWYNYFNNSQNVFLFLLVVLSHHAWFRRRTLVLIPAPTYGWSVVNRGACTRSCDVCNEQKWE